MTPRNRRGPGRSELPEILAAILEAQGASVQRRGSAWEAELPAALERELGTARVRILASPAGRAARGAENDAAATERILHLGRSRGAVTRLVAEIPAGKGGAGEARHWARLHWRIRYGIDDVGEELLTQTMPIGGRAVGVRPLDAAFREPSPEEQARLVAPDPEALASTWMRALRLLESRIRLRMKPHEDKMRRELHREMRQLSVHFRSLIAEERSGRRRRAEEREAGRMLQLKEDWERKLAAAVRQRALDTEARLVAVALLSAVPVAKPPRGAGDGPRRARGRGAKARSGGG
jgi:hypothetical protein